MITWDRVYEDLKAHCIYLTDLTLKGALTYLYKGEKLSVKQVVELIDGKCSTCSLRAKMKELGIDVRGRGGPNYTKPFTISKEEYKGSSYKEMAFKYKVNMTTIRNRCQKYIKEEGKKGRSK